LNLQYKTQEQRKLILII